MFKDTGMIGPAVPLLRLPTGVALGFKARRDCAGIPLPLSIVLLGVAAAGSWNGEAVVRLQARHDAAPPPPPPPSPHVFALAPLALKQLTLCRGARAAVISVWQEHLS